MFERLATIRAITTAVATIVVALALTVGAIGLVAAARSTMVNEVTEAARKQAAEVVVNSSPGGHPPSTSPVSDEQMVQVMTPAGAVVASSPNVAGDPAVARLAPGQSARVITPLDNDAVHRGRRECPDRRRSADRPGRPGRLSTCSTPRKPSPGC